MINKFFTKARVANAIKNLPPVKTFLMDELYKNRATYHNAYIPISEIIDIVQEVPVVKRGSTRYSLNQNDRKLELIEPQPIDIDTFVTAKELNDLKMLDDFSIQNWVTNKVDYLRKTIRKTSEALCCQTLTGSIAYAMKIENGIDKYQVDFGTIESYTPTTLWDDSRKKISDIDNDLEEMILKIENNGFGGNLVFYAGKKAFSTLSKFIYDLSDKNKIDVKIGQGEIFLNGKIIKRVGSSYYDHITKQRVNSQVENKITAIDIEAGFKLIYAAIDDLDSGLKAVPFFTKTIKSDNPSGYNIIGISKPLPIPVIKAMCEAVVTS